MDDLTLPAEPSAIRFDPARTALVIIDMQRDFVEIGRASCRERVSSPV